MTELMNTVATDLAAPYPILLDALHERCGGLTASPAGHVLASPARLPDAADGPMRRLGLAVSAGHPAESGAVDRFASGLLALHRDVLRRVLKQALGHLEGRTSAGTSLLSRQLVQGQLADAAMALNAEEAMPPDRREADPPARWRSHQRMVAVGRALIRLFGASGFLTDGPAADLHLAEVTGNVYLHPGGRDD
jgi:alkylation response protein AidB-like acyl-CoA dehydrogenase